MNQVEQLQLLFLLLSVNWVIFARIIVAELIFLKKYITLLELK